MNIAEQLQRVRDIGTTKEKLREVNSQISRLTREKAGIELTLEALELMRLEVLRDLADLGEITHDSIS